MAGARASDRGWARGVAPGARRARRIGQAAGADGGAGLQRRLERRGVVVLDDRGEVGVDVELGVGLVDAMGAASIVGALSAEHVAAEVARLVDERGRVEVV